jgi:hypothetical protein
MACFIELLIENRLESMAYGNRGNYYNSEAAMRWKDQDMDQKARAFCRNLNKKMREKGGSLRDAGVGAYPNNVGKFILTRYIFSTLNNYRTPS